MVFPCLNPRFFPLFAWNPWPQVVRGLDLQLGRQPPAGARLGAGAGGDQRGHPGRPDESKAQDTLRGGFFPGHGGNPLVNQITSISIDSIG